MKIEQTKLLGCFLLTPKIFHDERGCFFEGFNSKEFTKKTGIITSFVQDNISKSKKGVFRGLHFQTGDNAQAKLVTVIKGKVIDFCVDIRKESGTFGEYISVVLDDVNHKQLYIPKGFAHGFLALENDTIFSYKCDNYYSKDAESGIIFNDKTLNIDYTIPLENLIISKKDIELPSFKNYFNDY